MSKISWMLDKQPTRVKVMETLPESQKLVSCLPSFVTLWCGAVASEIWLIQTKWISVMPTSEKLNCFQVEPSQLLWPHVENATNAEPMLSSTDLEELWG